MNLHEIVKKWKINHGLLAKGIDMPKGTFSNKINPNHYSKFTDLEKSNIRTFFNQMITDLTLFNENENNQ